MPTVVVARGVQIKVTTADHAPAHVHVWTQTGVVVILLGDLSLREKDPSVKATDLRNAFRAVGEHIDACWAVWRTYYDED